MLINSNPHWRSPFIFRGYKIKFFYWKGVYIFSDTFPKFFAQQFLNTPSVLYFTPRKHLYTACIQADFSFPSLSPCIIYMCLHIHCNGPRGSIMVHLIDNPCFKFSKYMDGIIGDHCTGLHFKNYLNTYLPA